MFYSPSKNLLLSKYFWPLLIATEHADCDLQHDDYALQHLYPLDACYNKHVKRPNRLMLVYSHFTKLSISNASN